MQKKQVVKNQLLNEVSNPQRVSFNLLTDEDILINPIKGSDNSLIIVNVREAPYSAKPVYIGQDIRKTYIRLR